MLLGQNRGRYQDGRLFSVQYALHYGPHGNFRLSVTHVAAEEPVHRHRLFHVGFYLLYAAELVGGLLVGEPLFELHLPGRIRREGKALAAGALGIEGDEFPGQFLCRRFCAGFCALPFRAAHL